MITLDQIKKLDARVKAALERITALKEENSQLKVRLSEYERRIEELDIHVSRFKKEQGEIEAGIISVLAKLDSLEDDIEKKTPAEAPSADKAPQEALSDTDSEEAEEDLGAEIPAPGKDQLDIF
jgi:FtsZ-binding cell division protein ZapB